MITAADFLKWLSIFNVPSGGGGGGSVTQDEVQQSAFNFATTTGSDDAFVVTLSPAPTELTNGLLITMSSGSLQNLTSSPTLQVNSLAAKPISTFAGAPAPGDIQQGLVYLFIYNGAAEEFELINPTTTTADTFAVQGNVYNYALDSGTANAYIGNVLPVSDNAQIGGFSVLLNAIHTNTGASTLTVNSQEAPIVNQYGNALTGGEIVANSLVTLVYSDHYDSYMLVTPSTTGLPVLLDPAGQQTISTYGLTVPTLTTANLSFDVTANTIASTGTNENINIVPNGTGITVIGSSTALSPIGLTDVLQVIGASGVNVGIGLAQYRNNAGSPQYQIYKSRSTSVGTFVPVTINDFLGTFSFLGDDGTTFTSGANIQCQVTGSVSTGIVPSALTFRTCSTAGNLTTGMTLSNAQILTLANPLPAGSGGTGITSLGTGVPTALGQNVTGSGGIVLDTSPTISGTLTMSGTGNYDSINLVTSSNGFTYIAGMNNSTTNVGALIFGCTADASGVGTYTTLYNYQSTNFSFAMNTNVVLNLTETLATFTGILVAPGATFTKVNGTESSNAVTANGYAGIITTSSLSTAGGSSYAITWTNSIITTTSVIQLTINGGTNTTQNITMICVCGSGSATLTIYNNTIATALTGSILIGYTVF